MIKKAIQKTEAGDPANRIAYDFYAQAVSICQQHDFPFSLIRSWVLPFGYRTDPRGLLTEFYAHDAGRWQMSKDKLWPVKPHFNLQLLQIIRTWVEVTDVPTGLVGTPIPDREDYFLIEVAAAVLSPKGMVPLQKYPTTDEEYFALLLRHEKALLRQSKIASLEAEIFNLDSKYTIYLGYAGNPFSDLRPILPGTSILVGREDVGRPLALFRRYVDPSVRVRMVLRNYVPEKPDQQDFWV